MTVRGQWSEKKNPQLSKTQTRFFLSSLQAQQQSRAATAVRGHWSIENRTHHKRDASLWQVDRHRHRRPNAALNLALTRNTLLAIIPFKEGLPLANRFDLHCRRPATALALILNMRHQL